MSIDLLAIRTRDSIGSLTCFAYFNKDNVKRLYGISAAHVLLGKNRKVELNDTIDIYYSKVHLNWFNKAGLLEAVYFINGTGIYPEWGLLDAGTFLLAPKVSELIKDKLTTLTYCSNLKNPKLLKDTLVYGYAVQSQQQIKGRIANVFIKVDKFDLNFDIQIEFIEGRTNKGDSGMLWRTQNGAAVGMHVYGDNSYSYATLISRIRNRLGMPLLRLKV